MIQGDFFVFCPHFALFRQNLLGLHLTTNKIQVNISAQQGQAELVGNMLGDPANLLNLPAVNSAVNSVLSSAVTLLNSGSLSLAGVNTTSGSLSFAPAGSSSTTNVLTLQVAPVKLNLLGAEVTTSPIDLTLTAQPGQGLVLGNVVTGLANLFNPPLPSTLSIDDLNTRLGNLLNELNTQIPNVGNPTSPPVNLGPGQFLNLTVAPINLNLLGLVLQTSSITVNATNQTGNGDLLGNVATTLLNTVGTTPQNLFSQGVVIRRQKPRVQDILQDTDPAQMESMENPRIDSCPIVNRHGTSSTNDEDNTAPRSPSAL